MVDMKVVFAYLGKKLPKYAKTNIKNVSLKFPDERFVLLVDHSHNFNFGSRNNVEVIRLPDPSVSWASGNDILQNHEYFENNFWYKTIARFKLIEDYMRMRDESILHIEADIVLNQNFPFTKIESIEKEFAFSLINQHQGIGSILYLKNYPAAKELLKFTEARLRENPKYTDMDILGKLLDMKRKQVFILPTIDSGSLLSMNATKHINRDMADNFNFFNGVFDAATLGQYFFGLDRVHTHGFVKTQVYLPHHSVDPRGIKLLIEDKVVSATVSDLKVEVFNFHMHSKINKLFLSNEKTIECFIKDKNLSKLRYFSFLAFYHSKNYILKHQIRKVGKFLKLYSN